MNHLAHLALADAAAAAIGDEPTELMVGGILGDFIKGRLDRPRPDLRLSQPVLDGIQLHRHIDTATARLPLIHRSSLRFGPQLRRYAPILLDIIGDHFLANDFNNLHHEKLSMFTTRCYQALATMPAGAPRQAHQLCLRLAEHDVLSAYVGTEIVERGFSRIAARLRASELVPAMVAGFRENFEPLRADFADYYPSLRVAAIDWYRATVAASDA